MAQHDLRAPRATFVAEGFNAFRCIAVSDWHPYLVACGGEASCLYIFDARMPEAPPIHECAVPKCQKKQASECISGCDFSANGRHVAASFSCGNIFVFDLLSPPGCDSTPVLELQVWPHRHSVIFTTALGWAWVKLSAGDMST